MEQTKMQEMIKVIKDAGMYEDNMSKDDIKIYYKALSESKDFSTLEDEARRFMDEEDMFDAVQEKEASPNTCTSDGDPFDTSGPSTENNFDISTVFQPKTWSVDKKNIDKEKHSTETSLEEKSGLDATKADFGFHDMPKPTDKTLSIIHRSPKYTCLENSKKFLTANMVTKAMMLYSHYTKMEKQRSQLARQSFFPAAMPKPILLKEVFTPSLDLMDNDSEETYVSRSGRQTKRKLYTDFNEDSMEATPVSNKKSKSKIVEIDWATTSKAETKSITKKLETLQKSESAQTLEAMDIEETEAVQKEIPKSRSKKPSNAEIISRSSLFADSPKRGYKSSRSKRCELMFDKLVEETEKKQKEEKIQTLFEKSLESDDSQTISQTDEDVINIADDEPVPRRVVPPIPTRRRAINSRNKSEKAKSPPPLKINVERATGSSRKEDNSSEEFFESFSFGKNQKSTRSAIKENGLDVISTSDAGSSTDVLCPICSNRFPESSIVEHAASCGEDQMITRYNVKQKLACEICEKVIFEDYDLHVMDCKRRHEESDYNKRK